MKRSLRILLLASVCALLLFSVAAQAQTYDISETDMTVEIDDSYWYVFTRDNLRGNPELEELGVSESYMSDFFAEGGVYVDALLLYESGATTELYIRKSSDSDFGVTNLSNYSRDEVMELAEALAEKQGAEDYTVYEGRYTFTQMEYIAPTYGYYICEYLTVVNKDAYVLTAQSETPLSDAELEEFERIVDSIHFDVDEALKEPSRINWGFVLLRVLDGAIIGGAVALILGQKKRKKKKQNAEAMAFTDEADE